MSLFRRRTTPQPATHPWKITRKCLDLIFESSKSNYPQEFGALLRVDRVEKNTIVEVVLLPGTISGDSHAIFHLHMLPIDYQYRWDGAFPSVLHHHDHLMRIWICLAILGGSISSSVCLIWECILEGIRLYGSARL